MIRTLIAALAIGVAPFAASATTITFEGLDASSGQTIPLLSFSEGGFTFNVTGGGNNAGVAVFDSSCGLYGPGCNTDPDLSPASQGENGIEGNILILQDNTNNALTPDDDAQPGSITLTLVSGPAFRILGFSMIDDVTISLAGNGQALGSDALTGEAETSLVTVASSPLFRVGDSFTFSFSGSGGIDSIQLTPVPLPAALPMLLIGMGGLAWAARRRRT